MKPEEDICVCHHVSLRKLQSFVKRKNPKVASQLSECLGAGTSCGWCIPFLNKLHQCHIDGQQMELSVSFENYSERRKQHNAKKTAQETNHDAGK